jgi:putative membrane protein
MYNLWGMGWGMWFWLLVIIGFGYIFYIMAVNRTPPRYDPDPLEVARLRLAKGEITSEEFEKIRETLKGSR